jgi:hypothetical protein
MLFPTGINAAEKQSPSPRLACLQWNVPSTRKSKVANKLEILQAENLAQFPWLVHGFSTRTGGTSRVYGGNALNLGITEKDTRAAVERNRAAFLKALNVPEWPVVSVRQIHSDLIWPVPDPLSGADEVSVGDVG